MVNRSQVIPTKSPVQFEREQFRRNSPVPQLWLCLDQVKDPEIPALSLWDIGILKDIKHEGELATVTITPTYSSCPAMDAITEDIEIAFKSIGIKKTVVVTELSPAWTTEWMTEKGRNQLRDYGIAPPNDVIGDSKELTSETQVACPQCGSANTQLVSEFGSTACKALFTCNACHEPFDLFKHI